MMTIKSEMMTIKYEMMTIKYEMMTYLNKFYSRFLHT